MTAAVAMPMQMSFQPASDKLCTDVVKPKFRDNKTRLCTSFVQGHCAQGDSCKFVHDLKAQTPAMPLSVSPQGEVEAPVRNKDLFKTKLCEDFLYRTCPRGDSCNFAHHTSEMRAAPNLAKTQLCTKFMNGKCFNDACTYAHGEAELVKPPNFKKKLCSWNKEGTCRNGDKCAFAHCISELCEESQMEWFRKKQPWNRNPGFGPKVKDKPSTRTHDIDASTAVPSESLAQSDMSTMSTSAMPEERMFRMMAGRGSAPLQQQVESMKSAVADLEAKLAESSDPAMQATVDQMKRTIEQLGETEARLRTKQATAPKVTTDVHRASANKPSAKQAKPWWDNTNVKCGLTMVLVAMMAAAEYSLHQ